MLFLPFSDWQYLVGEFPASFLSNLLAELMEDSLRFRLSCNQAILGQLDCLLSTTYVGFRMSPKLTLGGSYCHTCHVSVCQGVGDVVHLRIPTGSKCVSHVKRVIICITTLSRSFAATPSRDSIVRKSSHAAKKGGGTTTSHLTVGSFWFCKCTASLKEETPPQKS